jgi:hypothetical protein
MGMIPTMEVSRSSLHERIESAALLARERFERIAGPAMREDLNARIRWRLARARLLTALDAGIANAPHS